MKQNQLYLDHRRAGRRGDRARHLCYREESKPDGVELRIDDSGISIEQN